MEAARTTWVLEDETALVSVLVARHAARVVQEDPAIPEGLGELLRIHPGTVARDEPGESRARRAQHDAARRPQSDHLQHVVLTSAGGMCSPITPTEHVPDGVSCDESKGMCRGRAVAGA